MNQPILSLWRYLWRVPLQLALTVTLPFFSPVPYIFVCFALVAAVLIVHWRNKWVWLLVNHVRHFHTTSSNRIVLHYDPKLVDQWNFPLLLDSFQEELDHLAQRFGAPLRKRVHVFLFEGWKQISKIFNPSCGGRALYPNVILIAADCRELWRHEFAHLFSNRWNNRVPPLLSEGLSVWLQETTGGLLIDEAARPLLDDQSLKLPSLLKPNYFFSEPQILICYVLAGSFTGFLIRRYGWDRFRNFYQCCNYSNFSAKFKKCFGLTFAAAEARWRGDLVKRAGEVKL